MKRILTIEQLIHFCEQNKFYNFSSKDTGYQLCVQMPAVFEKEENKDDSLLFAKVKVFHTGRNRNKSNVTEEAAKKAMKTMAYKPILAAFTDVNGESDFTTHEGEIDEDGNWVYTERQIGCFTADKPYMEEDPDNKDRKYIYAYAAIPRIYTDAADIIERKDGTKVSVELAVNEMSFDAENKELVLEDIIVMGCTCLGVDPDTGEEIGEGMEGSRLDIEDFSVNNNSVFTNYNTNEELIKTLEKLNKTLSILNIDNSEKEVKNEMSFMEQLLEKYNVTINDIDFDFETMSDEELEQAFADKFETSEEKVEESDPIEVESEEESEKDEPEEESDATDNEEFDGENENDENEDDEDEYEDDACGIDDEEVKPRKYSIEFSDGSVKEFELSLQDKISALDALVNETYSEADNDYYYTLVFDKNVVMVSYWTGKAYRQAYKERKGVYSLQGDRVSVHSIYVTDDEEAEFDRIKSNYSVIESELAQYHDAEEKAKKDALMNSCEYSAILDSEEYKNIEVDNYNFDELKNELDSILLTYAKSGKLNFAAKDDKETKVTKPTGIKPLPFTEKKKKGRYGSLFSK